MAGKEFLDPRQVAFMEYFLNQRVKHLAIAYNPP